jgi:co-chaperonin GroES (HSP10)
MAKLTAVEKRTLAEIEAKKKQDEPKADGKPVQEEVVRERVKIPVVKDYPDVINNYVLVQFAPAEVKSRGGIWVLTRFKSKMFGKIIKMPNDTLQYHSRVQLGDIIVFGASINFIVKNDTVDNVEVGLVQYSNILARVYLEEGETFETIDIGEVEKKE